MALAPHVRTLRGQHAKLRLAETVDLNQYPTLGVYWPMRGEINVREIARKHIDAGGVIGLPVVVERGAPVEFGEWHPGTKMQRGLWDIPIPAARNVVRPQALVIPLVGFDEQGYRLGYAAGTTTALSRQRLPDRSAWASAMRTRLCPRSIRSRTTFR